MSTPTGCADPQSSRRQIASALILLLYPVWSHTVIATDLAPLSLPGLVVLAALALAVRGAPGKRGMALAALAALLVAAITDLAITQPVGLYLPPIALPLALAFVFGRTLLPGRTSLVELIATAIYGDDHSNAELRYMRGVTWLWTLLCGGLAIHTAALALWASPQAWSLFANFLNYLIIAGVMGIEYFVRCSRFGWPSHPLRFWIGLARMDWQGLGYPRNRLRLRRHG